MKLGNIETRNKKKNKKERKTTTTERNTPKA